MMVLYPQILQRLLTDCKKENSSGLQPKTFSEKTAVERNSSALSRDWTPYNTERLTDQGFENMSATPKHNHSPPCLSLHYYTVINQADTEESPLQGNPGNTKTQTILH